MTLRQAALVAGFTYLLNPVGYAEYTLYPKLVVPGNVDASISNIAAHHGLFLAMLFCYLVGFLEDVVLAWALYVLLAPVNRSLSLLAAWFQVVYATIALVGTFNLAIVFRMLTTAEYMTLFGAGALAAQIDLLLHSFRYDFALSLGIFGIHLALVGYLIVRSSYIPWWLGVILCLDGAAWIVNSLGPYLYPSANLDPLFVFFLGELVFMVWLLVRGWTIREPALPGRQIAAPEDSARF